jgi:general secretion pathway protein F
MAAFDYIALDQQGARHKGVLQGDSARQVRARLRDQGLLPLTVEPVADDIRRSGSLRWRRGFKPAEQALLLRQLATLLRSGQPLAEALQALTRGEQPARLRNVVAALRAQVLEGRSLAAAMGSFPNHFSEMMTASVAAGERAGKLNEVMHRLADYTQNRERIGNTALMALLYPVLLAVLSIVIVAGLVTYVVPRVVVVFSNYQQQLPWPTRLLMGISDLLRDHGLLLLVAALLAGLLGWWLLQQPVYRQRLQSSLLRMPVLGRLLRASESARLTRTLAIMLGSAVPVTEALQASARVAVLLPVRQSIEQAARSVREGSSMARALEQGGWMPAVVLQLIHSGEQSGDLPYLLDQAAAIQEQELDAATALLSNLAQPILIMLVGVMVLFIVLAIMLPILDMNTLVGG